MAKDSLTPGIDFKIRSVEFEIATRENELDQEGADEVAAAADRPLANKIKYLDALKAKRARHVKAADRIDITRTNKSSGETRRRSCCKADLGFFEDQGFAKAAARGSRTAAATE